MDTSTRRQLWERYCRWCDENDEEPNQDSHFKDWIEIQQQRDAQAYCEWANNW